MNTLFGFDTETTGIPNWKIPSDDDLQPHIVQVAGVIMNADTTDIIQSIDVIVRPHDWVIPKDLTEIHGISHEYAMDVGLHEKVVAEMIYEMAKGRKRIAYNTTFDNRIIRIALKRYFGSELADDWKKGEYECAMMLAKKTMGGKQPKLIDAYRHFTGLELENAHSAMADTHAAMEVYFACKSAETPVAEPPAPKTKTESKEKPATDDGMSGF